MLVTKREFVTPDKATAWLAMNGLNRKVHPTGVHDYAVMMERGEWNYGHDDAPVGTIVKNCDGSILDGGHRLAAVVKCGKGQWFNVQTGMPTESAILIDRGRRKSFPDMIRMWCLASKQPVPNYLNELCAGLQQVFWLTKFPGKHHGPEHRITRPTDQLESFKKYGKELHRFIDVSYAARPFVSHGAAAALWMLMSRKDAAAADEFFEKFITGEGVRTGEPVGVLRNRLIQDRAVENMRERTFDTVERIIRAWNATRAGKRWTRMEPNHGEFPVIR